MLWEELSSKEFEKWVEKSEKVCILPIGAIEKHADHLPLGTDMIVSTTIAKKAAELSPAVVFPYYFFGQIAEAKHVKGTISASHRLLMDALLEMCDEIHRNGFEKIIILNAHGGNNNFLQFFAQMFPGIGRSYAVYTCFAGSKNEEQMKAIIKKTGVTDMGAHAGFAETAIMAYLRPDLVHPERSDVTQGQKQGRLDNLSNQNVFTGFSWYADYPNHFAGDHTKATKEFGEFIFNIVIENVVKIINEVKKDKTSLPLIAEFNNLAK